MSHKILMRYAALAKVDAVVYLRRPAGAYTAQRRLIGRLPRERASARLAGLISMPIYALFTEADAYTGNYL